MARYDLTRYWTTHNSYEGQQRDWLPVQLDKKVRCVELDVWDNDYAQFGDYRLGHLKPGHAVVLGDGSPGQNPSTLLLKDWLAKIADWSARNNGNHAPITVVLDVKSDLTDNDDAGDLEDLNHKLAKAFGDQLFTRDDYDAAPAREWPDTAELRGRFICVLSGNSNTRLSYRYCFGEKPAIAVDSDGNVVLAYRSGGGDMRYWSGLARTRSKRVEWTRKGTYAFNNPNTVSEPSLAMTDDGFVVSVHRIGPRPQLAGPALLECKVGELQDDGRIAWGAPDAFGDGMEPSVSMVSANKLEEIHKTPSGKSLRLREGTLNRSKKKVEWKDSQATQGPPFPRDTVDWDSHQLRCLTNATGLILCSFDGAQTAVGYRQLAFVELQNEEQRTDLLDPLFYGASAGEKGKLAQARNAGLAARAWWFKDGDQAAPPSPPQENAAGTDFPFEQWYTDYMNQGGQAEF